MTELFERATLAVSSLPPETQDEIAGLILAMIEDRDESPIVLSAEEWAAIDRSMAQAAAGEFATAEEIAAVWNKFRL